MAKLFYIKEGMPNQRAITFLSNGNSFALQVGESIDIDFDIKRLQREIDGHDQDIAQCRQRLDNPEFHAKAKPEIIEEIKERLRACEQYKQHKESQLSQLSV